MQSHEFRFTDHAAGRAFEYGLEHSHVIEALESDHFKQAAVELGSLCPLSQGQRSVAESRNGSISRRP